MILSGQWALSLSKRLFPGPVGSISSPIRPPLPGEKVDHIDGRRDNNEIGNLRRVTHRQNIRAGML
jgi:hypothetical protein